MRLPPDLPRKGAPLLFALVDTACGASLIGQPVLIAQTRVAAFMPLGVWALSFITLGLLVLGGARSRRFAQLSALAGVGWWSFYGCLEAELVPGPAVTIRAPIVAASFAVLHFLLLPYWRRQ